MLNYVAAPDPNRNRPQPHSSSFASSRPLLNSPMSRSLVSNSKMNAPVDFDLNPSHIKRLQTGPLIGRGTFGLVFKGGWNGQAVAIKQIVGENERLSFSQEVAHLSRVNHENIIKCYGYSLQHVLLVVEYADCGSLHQLLHAPRNKSVHYNIAHALSWVLQCARGVQHLHAMKPKPIVHRDLKPLNLLLTDRCRTIKICDFGTACAIHTNMTVAQGSVAWMAPEVFQGHNYTEKCDIFSLGITLWQVLARRLPYFNLDSPAQSELSTESQNNSAVASGAGGGGGAASFRIMWAVHSGERPQLLRNCPQVLEQLMESCWAEQPKERPCINQVITQIERLFKVVSKYSKIPLDLPPEQTYQESISSDSQSSQSGYELPDQIVTEPPISQQEKPDFDPSITLPASISLHNKPDNSDSHQTLSQSTSQNLSSTSLSKKKQFNESSASSTNPCKLTRTLVNQFSSNWFDGHSSSEQNQTLKPKLLQPQLSSSQRPTSPKLNVFSASSELRVHPPSGHTATATTNSSNNMSASISLNNHNTSPSIVRSDSELSEFIYLLDPKTLDPQHLLNARLQTPIQIELLSPIQNYRRRFHEFLSMINKVMQSKCLDNSMRVGLVSARNELHGQLVNLRRLLKQREAAEDGWEYVDQ